ncbi:nucleotidyltransferase domain-containing protein [Terrilactibacillus laevilacticus]|uniref:nucleotidyltransferase domain-containing protein n=1 Tax=Terrilactibacillus laevilacticus TaxID=1380157 RepID=UPI0011475BC3
MRGSRLRKSDPLQIAKQFVKQYHPNCDMALLSGSVARGDETDTSDLDIVIIDSHLSHPFRKSYLYGHQPIECFVHNEQSLVQFFQSDCERGRPSLPHMVAEGLTIIDKGLVQTFKEQANQLLRQGPRAWTDEEIAAKRYFITDLLEDFEGCRTRSEGIFIAGQLADAVHIFILRMNQRWIGSSKWIYKSMANFDQKVCADFVQAFDTYYKRNNKDEVIRFVDQTLLPYGGRYFDGFSIGE